MKTASISVLLLASVLSFSGTVSGIASTPALVLRGTFPDTGGSWIEEVKVVGDYAYLANAHAGFRIVDVSDPLSPSLVAGLPLGESVLARGVAVEGSRAYIADWLTGLYVIDISDPSTPLVMGHSPERNTLIDLEAATGYAYVGEYPYGLRVFEAIDPTQPEAIAFRPTHRANSLAAQGDYVYVAAISSGLMTFDVTNPLQPELASQYWEADYHVHEVTVAGDYAYTLELNSADSRSRRLGVIDVSDVQTPEAVGHLQLSSGYFLASDGGFVVVGNQEGRLQLVDVTDARAPRSLSFYSGEAHGWEYPSRRPCFANGLLYWPNGEYGLQILSIEEPPDISISQSDTAGAIQVDWEQLPGAKLQRCSNLVDPVWEDVSEGGIETLTSIPNSEPQGFFRVIKDIP